MMLHLACSALLALVLGVIVQPASAQQRPDTSFKYTIATPAFAQGAGPVVAIDAAHHNFHVADGRYAPFASLVAADGFQVKSSSAAFDAASLADIDVLVVANALHPDNVDRWALPTPSAFTPAEIAALQAWVEAGGSLLLIADHMPFAGAAAELATAFGFTFLNGYAADGAHKSTNMRFTPDGSERLDLGPLGDEGLPAIDQVATFTGQAFTIPAGAHSLLTLVGKHAALMPAVAGRFETSTPRVNIEGWSQGAVMEVGEGRLAVFGEAAAFSAQIGTDDKPMGMNADGAEDNPPFVLRVIRWLAKLDAS